MQILLLLGMYYDAVVVEVERYLLFSDWLWPYCGILCGVLHFTLFQNLDLFCKFLTDHLDFLCYIRLVRPEVVKLLLNSKNVCWAGPF